MHDIATFKDQGKFKTKIPLVSIRSGVTADKDLIAVSILHLQPLRYVKVIMEFSASLKWRFRGIITRAFYSHRAPTSCQLGR